MQAKIYKKGENLQWKIFKIFRVKISNQRQKNAT